ncbi:hypothetical protein FRC12_023055, partial [Ceratobasidium sp. 428]
SATLNPEGHENAPVSLPELEERRSPAIKAYFEPFAKQGTLNEKSRIDLAVVRLICAAGIPPRILSLPEWDNLIRAVAPKLRNYESPSVTTLADKLIPAEAQLAVVNMRHFSDLSEILAFLLTA